MPRPFFALILLTATQVIAFSLSAGVLILKACKTSAFSRQARAMARVASHCCKRFPLRLRDEKQLLSPYSTFRHQSQSRFTSLENELNIYTLNTSKQSVQTWTVFVKSFWRKL